MILGMDPSEPPAAVAAEPKSNVGAVIPGTADSTQPGEGHEPREPASERSRVPVDVRPGWSLWLLSVAHAVNHAQGVVLPLIFLKIIDDFHVGVDTIAFLAAIGAFASGIVQLSFASLTRLVSRRNLLAVGGVVVGGGFVAQAFASGV